MNETLCLSWTPPFTLDLTDVDPDLHYMIEITSTVAAEDRFTISCDDCSTGYKFTANSSSPCDSFTFVVVPVNAAGNGTPSDPLQGSFIEGRYTLLLTQDRLYSVGMIIDIINCRIISML